MKQIERIFQVVLFVGIWMIAGWTLHPGIVAYQFFGLALCCLLQVYVCKRSITDSWVRGAGRFHLDRLGITLAVVLAAAPMAELITMWSAGDWWYRIAIASAVAGAVPAAFAVRRMNREGWRSLLLCFFTGGSFVCVFTFFFCYARHSEIPLEPWRIRLLLSHWLIGIPALFVVEEVVFRGVLDSHVYHPGDRNSFWSALLLSVLWGWWHVPILPTSPWWQGPISYPLTHALLGIPLSIYWRRSGNLFVPVVIHAFADAMRDAFLYR